MLNRNVATSPIGWALYTPDLKLITANIYKSRRMAYRHARKLASASVVAKVRVPGLADESRFGYTGKTPEILEIVAYFRPWSMNRLRRKDERLRRQLAHRLSRPEDRPSVRS